PPAEHADRPNDSPVSNGLTKWTKSPFNPIPTHTHLPQPESPALETVPAKDPADRPTVPVAKITSAQPCAPASSAVAEDSARLPENLPTPLHNAGQSQVAVKSMSSWYGHAPDYHWLIGELQQWRKEWRLRYAPIDEEDTYGGTVTLLTEGPLENLKHGQKV